MATLRTVCYFYSGMIDSSDDTQDNIQEEQYSPTEAEISKTIQEQKYFKDPFASTIISDCFGKTPLHEAVIYKREDVVDCFLNFQGKTFTRFCYRHCQVIIIIIIVISLNYCQWKCCVFDIFISTFRQ